MLSDYDDVDELRKSKQQSQDEEDAADDAAVRNKDKADLGDEEFSSLDAAGGRPSNDDLTSFLAEMDKTGKNVNAIMSDLSGPSRNPTTGGADDDGDQGVPDSSKNDDDKDQAQDDEDDGDDSGGSQGPSGWPQEMAKLSMGSTKMGGLPPHITRANPEDAPNLPIKAQVQEPEQDDGAPSHLFMGRGSLGGSLSMPDTSGLRPSAAPSPMGDGTGSPMADDTMPARNALRNAIIQRAMAGLREPVGAQMADLQKKQAFLDAWNHGMGGNPGRGVQALDASFAGVKPEVIAGLPGQQKPTQGPDLVKNYLAKRQAETQPMQQASNTLEQMDKAALQERQADAASRKATVDEKRADAYKNRTEAQTEQGGKKIENKADQDKFMRDMMRDKFGLSEEEIEARMQHWKNMDANAANKTAQAGQPKQPAGPKGSEEDRYYQLMNGGRGSSQALQQAMLGASRSRVGLHAFAKMADGSMDLTPSEQNVLATEIDRVINGSAPTEAGIKAQVPPHTLASGANGVMSWLTNEPRGAGQQEFVKRMLGNLKTIGEGNEEELKNQRGIVAHTSGARLYKANPEAFKQNHAAFGFSPDEIDSMFGEKSDEKAPQGKPWKDGKYRVIRNGQKGKVTTPMPGDKIVPEDGAT